MQVIDAGHFWAQPGDRESAAKLRQLMTDINNYDGRQLDVSLIIRAGCAKILSII